MKVRILLLNAIVFFIVSCERVDNTPEIYYDESVEDSVSVACLSSVARLLASLPIGVEQMAEVHDAAGNSVSNGYDEEYMMKNLFSCPGSGVGDDVTKAPSDAYGTTMRDLLRQSFAATKAGNAGGGIDGGHGGGVDGGAGGGIGGGAGGFSDITEEMLVESDIQIYWPYSELWDGETLPIITYNPGGGAVESDGWMLSRRSDGTLAGVPVRVDEQTAVHNPVWVVNRNDDSGYLTVDMLRRSGDILPQSTKAPVSSDVKTLILKDFTMLRNYDSWLAGASEFWVKIGSLENFYARTEEELKIYEPLVTDFMIVVRRDELGVKRPFNAVLVSDWTPALSSCALMITEDDGGTMTVWSATAVVKVNSKSYGIDLSIPFHRHDDIVWRGSLSYRYITASSNLTGHFGDVEMTFEVVDAGGNDE